MRRDDFSVWRDKFLPEEDEYGDIKRYETYGEELEEAKRKAGEQCEYLWTVIEGGDNGNLYLSPGYHFVNRMFYVICRNTWKENTRTYKY